ncbi:hypothetical protein BH09PAT2_BH09PAT2_00120 [soil metagenome]
MQSFDYVSKIITPPLYTLYLIPFFAIFHDVRSFFIANMLLAFGSIGFFVLISRKLFKGSIRIATIIFMGFFLVTNVYFYIQTSLLMAENITFFLSMVGMYLCIDGYTQKKAIAAGIMGTLLVLIKFANIPLAISFYSLYGVEIIRNKKHKNLLIPFFLSATIFGIIFLSYIYTSQILVGHKNLAGGSSFAASYFIPNMTKYLSFIIGSKAQYIWYGYRMISLLLVIPAIVGIAIGLFSPQFRKVTLHMLIYGLSIIVFMSFFYFVDARYIFIVYPILLIFVGITVVSLQKYIPVRTLLGCMGVIVLLYLFFPQFGYVFGERGIITYKKQIGLNFKHAEVPWHYIAVQEFNTYFKNPQKKKPYLGTFLHPYFVGAYTNNNYKYLPIDAGQEFFYDKKNLPKEYVKSLPEYYKKLLQEGNKVYISQYFENNNAAAWEKSYDTLTSQFDMKEVHKGCLGSCTIYSLSLKK